MSDHGDTDHLRRLLAANDVTQAAQVAVERVVAVLGCEVSWAGFVQGERLVMGAHLGLHTPEMAATWNLGIGEGIGGAVAARGEARMTSDYQRDPRRVVMKRLIDNEAIVSVFVVPIRAAERTLGVLYAAHRTAHAWQPPEQSALAVIAEDLGVRLKQLDVDGETKREAMLRQRQAERGYDFVQQNAMIAARYLQADDMRVAVEALSSQLGSPVELRGADTTRMFSSGVFEDAELNGLVTEPIEHTGGLNVVMRAGEADDALQTAARALAIGLFKLQIARLSERQLTTERLRGELLDQLLSGRIADPESVKRRLGVLGLNLSNQALVAVCGPREERGGIEPRFVDDLRTTFAGCMLEQREGRLVALIPLAKHDANGVQESIGSLIRRHEPKGGSLVAGIAGPCREPHDIALAYLEARAACEVLRGEHARPAVVSARELGLQGLASLPPAQLRATVLDVLGPLLEADEHHGTAHLETLRTYLGHDRHLPDTSRELRVHYNTVRNRIARIEQLLGVDTRNVDDRFRLETALRMESVWRALLPTDREL